MRKLDVDDRVTLTDDIPDKSLRRGDRGVVRSIWFSPQDSYEVEFAIQGAQYPSRCIVLERQVELEPT